jgi:hypothetical protein
MPGAACKRHTPSPIEQTVILQPIFPSRIVFPIN